MVKSFTSASANKFLRVIENEKEQLRRREEEGCTYVLADGENLEPPVYDYEATRARIAEIDRQVRIVRHALHAFNVSTKLPDSELTVDDGLIELAQLSCEQRRLDWMRQKRPKVRVVNNRSNILFDPRDLAQTTVFEYEYTNYDIARTENDYQALTERICDLQLKIDLCNQTVTFEVDV